MASDCKKRSACSLSSSTFRLIVTAVSRLTPSQLHHAIAASSKVGPRIVASRSTLKEARYFWVMRNVARVGETCLFALPACTLSYRFRASDQHRIGEAMASSHEGQGWSRDAAPAWCNQWLPKWA